MAAIPAAALATAAVALAAVAVKNRRRSMFFPLPPIQFGDWDSLTETLQAVTFEAELSSGPSVPQTRSPEDCSPPTLREFAQN